MKTWGYILLLTSFVLILINGCENVDDDNGKTVTDIDGNVYTTITIGTQVWMKENLKTTRYNDNTIIPYVTNGLEWSNLTSPGYCWYDNNSAAHKEADGALYNWYAVNTGKLCPVGWHIPTLNDLNILAITLGGENVAGGKMKESGFAHWDSPNTGADNSSGFTALPSGYRYHYAYQMGYGFYGGIGSLGIWWSAQESSTSDAFEYSLSYPNSRLNTGGDYYKGDGLSVRCIKD